MIPRILLSLLSRLGSLLHGSELLVNSYIVPKFDAVALIYKFSLFFVYLIKF